MGIAIYHGVKNVTMKKAIAFPTTTKRCNAITRNRRNLMLLSPCIRECMLKLFVTYTVSSYTSPGALYFPIT